MKTHLRKSWSIEANIVAVSYKIVERLCWSFSQPNPFTTFWSVEDQQMEIK